MSVVYRLRAWPELPPAWRTARVLRTLSRMTIGPVTHGWFLSHSQLEIKEAERLIEHLVLDGVVVRTDLADASNDS